MKAYVYLEGKKGSPLKSMVQFHSIQACAFCNWPLRSINMETSSSLSLSPWSRRAEQKFALSGSDIWRQHIENNTIGERPGIWHLRVSLGEGVLCGLAGDSTSCTDGIWSYRECTPLVKCLLISGVNEDDPIQKLRLTIGPSKPKQECKNQRSFLFCRVLITGILYSWYVSK